MKITLTTSVAAALAGTLAWVDPILPVSAHLTRHEMECHTMMKKKKGKDCHVSPTKKPAVVRPPTRAPTSFPTKLLPTIGGPVDGPRCPGFTELVLPHAGHLYARKYTYIATWDEADAAAKELTCCGVQGHLVTVGDAAERDFFESMVSGTVEAAWVGLNDKADEGTYVWTDGTPFDTSLFTVDPFGDSANATDCGFVLDSTVESTWRSLLCQDKIAVSYIEFDCPPT